MQPTLFDILDTGQVVNVASVPQRSVFRYPGGKTWIVPRIRQWLYSTARQRFNLQPIRPLRLIEPFAGGGSVSLAAAAERLVDQVIMVEIDEDVASVWQTILDDEDAIWLGEYIEAFDLSHDNVTSYIARENISRRERAFKTILRNRVNRGGILAPGAGLLKEGENGKGLRSRWYPRTLKKRIDDIAKYRERITFLQQDGLAIIERYAHDPDAVFFIDPPYTAGGKKAGKRLYTHNHLNHEQLFDVVSNITGDFLITYDDTQEIRALARIYNFDVQQIPMRNTHHAEMTELLIGRDLGWVRYQFV